MTQQENFSVILAEFAEATNQPMSVPPSDSALLCSVFRGKMKNIGLAILASL